MVTHPDDGVAGPKLRRIELRSSVSSNETVLEVYGLYYLIRGHLIKVGFGHVDTQVVADVTIELPSPAPNHTLIRDIGILSRNMCSRCLICRT